MCVFCCFPPPLNSKCTVVLCVVIQYFLGSYTVLQDGGDGGVASPEAGWLEMLKGGVGDRGETQRGARHPRDVI